MQTERIAGKRQVMECAIRLHQKLFDGYPMGNVLQLQYL
jgi:hypothetical protein